MDVEVNFLERFQSLLLPFALTAEHGYHAIIVTFSQTQSSNQIQIDLLRMSNVSKTWAVSVPYIMPMRMSAYATWLEMKKFHSRSRQR